MITVPAGRDPLASASAPTPVNVPTSSTRRAAPTVTSAASSRLSTSALAICGAPEFAHPSRTRPLAVAGACGVVCAVAGRRRTVGAYIGPGAMILLVRFIGNITTMSVASQCGHMSDCGDEWQNLLLAALVLTIANWLVKPFSASLRSG